MPELVLWLYATCTTTRKREETKNHPHTQVLCRSMIFRIYIYKKKKRIPRIIKIILRVVQYSPPEEPIIFVADVLPRIIMKYFDRMRMIFFCCCYYYVAQAKI